MSSLLLTLLTRGDSVAIERGRLVIRPASGVAVPEQWLADNRLRLSRELLELVGMDAYEYDGYSTGSYGSSRRGGVTLQFVSAVNGEGAYAIFNADLTRARSVAGKKAGSPLPKGQFRVGKRSAFYKFWLSTGLPVRRLSDFHDYMGKLSGILLTGAIERARIEASTLRPMTLSDAEIAALLPDTIPTSARHHPDKTPTRAPDKETQQHQQPQGLQPFSTACVLNHGKTVIRRYGYTGDLSALHTQHAASPVDEWLDEYDSTQSLSVSASESASAGGQGEPMQLDSVPAWDDNDEEEL